VLSAEDWEREQETLYVLQNSELMKQMAAALATHNKKDTGLRKSKWMRSLVLDGNTWDAYEAMRENDKNLHKSLRKPIKDMLRSDDPGKGLGKPEPLKHEWR
jgi:hypothetical protein